MNLDALQALYERRLYYERDRDRWEEAIDNAWPAIHAELTEARQLLWISKEMLQLGRGFIDVNQQERDNWKGHAQLVEQRIDAWEKKHGR